MASPNPAGRPAGSPQSPTTLLRAARVKEHTQGVTRLERLMDKAVAAILRQVEERELGNLQWLVARLDGAVPPSQEACRRRRCSW